VLARAKWSRKHYRLESLGGHWVKLNRREDRISAQEAKADETTSSQMLDYPVVVNR
jgi:hypothetical protein